MWSQWSAHYPASDGQSPSKIMYIAYVNVCRETGHGAILCKQRTEYCKMHACLYWYGWKKSTPSLFVEPAVVIAEQHGCSDSGPSVHCRPCISRSLSYLYKHVSIHVSRLDWFVPLQTH